MELANLLSRFTPGQLTTILCDNEARLELFLEALRGWKIPVVEGYSATKHQNPSLVTDAVKAAKTRALQEQCPIVFPVFTPRLAGITPEPFSEEVMKKVPYSFSLVTAADQVLFLHLSKVTVVKDRKGMFDALPLPASLFGPAYSR